MQIIKHSLHNIHPLFQEIEQLYQLTSVREQNAKLVNPTINSIFKPVLDTFSQQSGTTYKVNYTERTSRGVENIPDSGNSIILCYSGGKDSTATALYYKEHNYKVYLYHLKGINKTYKDEWQNVEKLARALSLPVIIEEVSLSGKQEWIEHPLKNWIIANRALQYGIINNLTTNIAFGNFSSSTLNNDPFDVCGGDCKEMWQLYNNIIQTIIPGFEMQTPLINMQDTLDILMEHKDIAVMCQSCIGPYRYRDYLHKNNMIKYNLDLPEHRCFSCWKCCLEYIVYTDNDIYEYSEEMYKHCLDILRHTLKNEQGLRVKRDDVWEHYFFYDRDRSKYYG